MGVQPGQKHFSQSIFSMSVFLSLHQTCPFIFRFIRPHVLPSASIYVHHSFHLSVHPSVQYAFLKITKNDWALKSMISRVYLPFAGSSLFSSDWIYWPHRLQNSQAHLLQTFYINHSINHFKKLIGTYRWFHRRDSLLLQHPWRSFWGDTNRRRRKRSISNQRYSRQTAPL